MSIERIRKAKIEGDTEYLKAAGKKGAEVVNFRKKQEKVHAEIWEEVKAFEEAERKKSTNEDIISPYEELVED